MMVAEINIELVSDCVHFDQLVLLMTKGAIHFVQHLVPPSTIAPALLLFKSLIRYLLQGGLARLNGKAKDSARRGPTTVNHARPSTVLTLRRIS